jgi:uncharacterized protein YndB with AHSA1/START domain
LKLDVAYEELLPHPIEAVWAQLTDPTAISDWLMPTDDFRADVGCRFRMRATCSSSAKPSPTGWVEAEVLELEPPNRMVWSWSHNDGNPPSTVTFELVPENAGTLLRLRHVGELGAGDAGSMRDGWPGRIIALAETIGRAIPA